MINILFTPHHITHLKTPLKEKKQETKQNTKHYNKIANYYQITIYHIHQNISINTRQLMPIDSFWSSVYTIRHHTKRKGNIFHSSMKKIADKIKAIHHFSRMNHLASKFTSEFIWNSKHEAILKHFLYFEQRKYWDEINFHIEYIASCHNFYYVVSTSIVLAFKTYSNGKMVNIQ